MANEYAVNQSDLVQVADAIRTKGGTDNPLEFPSGFVDAIQNMSIGAEVNYTVNWYTSSDQISVWEENGIVVITSEQPTSHVFSEDEPTPEQGMVWFRTGTSSPLAFEPFKGYAFKVYPVMCYQYINREWKERSSGIYQGGNWKYFNKFLFNNGDTCNWITGGWTSEDATSMFGYPIAGVSIGNTLGVNTQSTQNYNISGALSTVNKIDFSEIDAIRVKGTISGYSGSAACVLYISSVRGNANQNVAFWPVATKGGSFEFIQDVSSYDGEYYVCLGAETQSLGVGNTTSMHVSEIEAAKNWG